MKSMRSMKYFLPALACLAAGLAFAGASSQDKAKAGIPEQEIGLSPGTVFDVPVPPLAEVTLSEPGESAVLPRAFPGSPPLITHLVAEFLPITRADNLCIDCHLIEEAGEGDPTALPASHRTDLRNAPEKVGEGVAGARTDCLLCHVVAGDAELLVGNDFPADADHPR